MAADFPYLTNPASLRKFLEKIRTVGVPEKVTIAYLASLGFKSANDRPIIAALKLLGFADGSGVPTETWQRYRPRETAGAVLAQAIRTTYSELFSIYPDAERKDNEALTKELLQHSHDSRRNNAQPNCANLQGSLRYCRLLGSTTTQGGG